MLFEWLGPPSASEQHHTGCDHPDPETEDLEAQRALYQHLSRRDPIRRGSDAQHARDERYV